MGALKVGILGAGNISPAYITGTRDWNVLELVAIADIDEAKARNVAAEHQIPAVMSVDQLLVSPNIDIVVNLTVPKAHADMSIRALEAGKHVYTEKPLAIRRADAKRILDTADAHGLRVGSAPDTFLFGQHQTVRRLIDEGAIGEPVAASANMAGHGPEGWHPNPAFFYQVGGGPLLDMGPYYITCLLNLLGPVRSVQAYARVSFPERVAGEAAGFQRIPVEIPTHYSGTLDFESGPLATVLMSFDMWKHNLPMLEIYGTEGSLQVPDPNAWATKDVLVSKEWGEWENVPYRYPDTYRRGIGLADMAQAILSGRPHRASGALAYHALDVMEAFIDSSEQGSRITLDSTIERPTPLPTDLLPRKIDA
ncbi:MAG: Gfo/Idh/MocA family oxidoreductase [Anaerolineae bacterium]